MIEYLTENMWQVWAVISVIFLIMELTGGDFFMICFSIGALFAMASVFVGVPPLWQLLVFAVFSVVSLFFVRPWAKRYIMAHRTERVSNADAIIGRVGMVSETIEARGYGRVALDGDDWKARSETGDSIEKGERVRILSRDSIIITVERI